MKVFRLSFWKIVFPAIAGVLVLSTAAVHPLSAQENEPAGGSKTEPDFHIVDNNDGSVTDSKTGLVWAKKDSYQALKKWLNWYMSLDYLKELNEKKFAGHDDWRFPTREELATLYDESHTIAWKYYWTTNEIHMDPIFVDPHCCIWTSDAHKEKYAWGFNFIRGQTYVSLKDTGVQYSLTAVRPVRGPIKP